MANYKQIVSDMTVASASRKQTARVAREIAKVKDALRRFHDGDKELNKSRTVIVQSLAEIM